MRIAYLLLLVVAAVASAQMIRDLAGGQPTAGPDFSESAELPASRGSKGTDALDASIQRDEPAESYEKLSGENAGTKDESPTVETAPAEVLQNSSESRSPADAEEPAATRVFPPIGVGAATESNSSEPGSDPERTRSVPTTEKPAVTVIRQQAPLHEQMVTPGNFEYLGAFRPPLSDQSGQRFSYGGWVATYHTGGDPHGDADGHPGSLFIVGHRHHQLIAEISIPRPVISQHKSLDDLPVADVLQPLSDITSGVRTRISRGSSEPFEFGGLQVVGNRLHWTLYKYYNVEGHDYLSHGMSTTNLQDPRPQGLWHLGPVNSRESRWHSYKHAGYICAVPDDVAIRYLGGRNILSGLQICTGLKYSSQGPALYAYGLPPDGTPHGSALNARPILWYSMNRPVANHHYADRWTGAAWITVDGKHTVVVAGRKAHGPVYYGPARPGDCYEDKGYHGSTYEAQMLFYAPGNLIAAATRPVADVQPWFRWDSRTHGGGLNRFMYKKCGKDVGGVAYDRTRNMLYLVEVDAGLTAENEWETLPVIHAFRIVD